MEPPGGLAPDRDRQVIVKQLTLKERPDIELSIENSMKSTSPSTTASISSYACTAATYSAATQVATTFSGISSGHTPTKQHHTPQHQHAAAPNTSLLFQQSGSSTHLAMAQSANSQSQQALEKLSRPMAFDKMESLVREMQDPENGVPVRQQKMFLTSIPYAFMGYDLIEWLMDRLLIEESEALNIANQLCLHGYFFPVNDTKTLTVKDDSSLYRFQTPYYWPWQHKAPDNVEYAIYLVKRSMRNKQRHALEDYEMEALASLHKNLKGKWEIIKMQAEEQVRLAKERKKGEKIVGDSQERAYWRVHRPPPGQFTPLEPCPVPSRDRQGTKQSKKKTVEDVQREVDYLRKSLNRTRMKMSQACESLVAYSETFIEYDFFLQPVLPSNPWVTEDVTFWQLNNTFVDIPTEKRVKRWAISIEELVSDPTGLQEFTTFLEKEYSHENIRFWIAVNRLRRSAHSQVSRKVQEIYEEFLKPGAPCEINIDGKTMESVLKGLDHPSRFTFDAASEHIYMLLLKKDCYPRFIRSEHYKRLLETGIQPAHKKRFFNFGGVGGAKKRMTAALSSQAVPGGNESSKVSASVSSATMIQAPPPPGSLTRRRGSDRSLSGSAHELAVLGVNKDATNKVPHSHSQSNLSEMPYREPPKPKTTRLESANEFNAAGSAVCPWETPEELSTPQTPASKVVKELSAPTSVQLSVCPWDQEYEPNVPLPKGNSQRLTSTSSDNSETNERIQRNLVMRHQNTVDSGETGMKRLLPHLTEQRRASVSFTPSRLSDFPLGQLSTSSKISTTPSPTVGSQHLAIFPTIFKPLQVAQSTTATAATLGNVVTHSAGSVSKDPPSISDVEVEELNRLSISERNSESSTSELPVLPTPTPTPTPPPIPTPPPLTKITPPAEVETQLREIETSPSENIDEDKKQDVEDNLLLTEEKFVAEVDAEVQEVQIELFEATTSEGYQKLCESQEVIEANTSTMNTVEEETKGKADYQSTLPLSQSPKHLTIEILSKEEVKENTNETVKHQNSEILSNSPEKEITTADSGNALAVVVDEYTQKPDLPVLALEDTNEYFVGPEELSPTTDEYQEGLQFGAEDKEVYDYGLGISEAGYIAPASTPAPAMAPLAEMDTDTVDEEPSEEVKPKEPPPIPTSPPILVKPLKFPVCPTPKYSSEEVKKRRKKRHMDGKKVASTEEKDKDKEKATTSTAAAAAAAASASASASASTTAATAATTASKDVSAKNDTDLATVCPWEDEIERTVRNLCCLLRKMKNEKNVIKFI
uniref:RGS domain-containing protein n=1 Tax=Glossina brevipalpis TaxID=37001 RepID=A0A1A9W2X3_9MUSC